MHSTLPRHLVKKAGKLALPLRAVTNQGSLELSAVDLDEVDSVGRLLLHDVRLELAVSDVVVRRLRREKENGKHYSVDIEVPRLSSMPTGKRVSKRRRRRAEAGRLLQRHPGACGICRTTKII